LGKRFGVDLHDGEQPPPPPAPRRLPAREARPTRQGLFDPRTSSARVVTRSGPTFLPPPKCAIIRTVLDVNERSGGTRRGALMPFWLMSQAAMTVEMESRPHIPCRPFLGGALLRGKTGADWRLRSRCAMGSSWGHDLQLAVGIARGAVLGHLLRMASVRDRLARWAGRVLARPYARLDHLSDR